MFLRLKLKKTDEFAMVNMNHVVRVEPGDDSDPEHPWCKLIHFPVQTGADGRPLLSKTEVAHAFDEVTMLLSGRWMTDPM